MVKILASGDDLFLQTKYTISVGARFAFAANLDRKAWILMERKDGKGHRLIRMNDERVLRQSRSNPIVFNNFSDPFEFFGAAHLSPGLIPGGSRTATHSFFQIFVSWIFRREKRKSPKRRKSKQNSPQYKQKNKNLAIIDQILIFNVVPAADHEDDRFAERRPTARNRISTKNKMGLQKWKKIFEPTLKKKSRRLRVRVPNQLRIEVSEIVRLGQRFHLHDRVDDLRHRQILKRKKVNKK